MDIPWIVPDSLLLFTSAVLVPEDQAYCSADPKHCSCLTLAANQKQPQDLQLGFPQQGQALADTWLHISLSPVTGMLTIPK